YTVARLEKKGYKVTGLDASAPMLRFARSHAPRSSFVLADARSFRLQQSFEAITCTFDSLNHLMMLVELEAAIESVHAALAPGGFFFFDMNMESGFVSHWADYYSIVEEDGACALRGHYDREARVGRYDITMFRRRGKLWQRSDTIVTERCYSMKEIKAALRRAGFKEFHVFDAVRDMGLSDHSGRKFFLARKAAIDKS
ncbi:MAG: class I SAM-dependent methyltransferase, partial [Acidobacteria bacterium]|nr:class I SAM-dependent methyltransferase [Acidobacteriota bacterium]